MTELQLQLEQISGRTQVTKRYFTSPLKLGFPKTENRRMQVVFMMASAGLLRGDSFDYQIDCGEGTCVMLTDQSYSKIFDTGEGRVRRRQKMVVRKDASLYYRPHAVIPFADSSYRSDMEVHLETGSEFAYADIVTAGRVGMGECYAFRSYRSRVCVRMEGTPIWLDHCRMEPAAMPLTGLYFMDGYTHQGTYYYVGRPENEANLLRYIKHAEKKAGDRLCLGASRARQGICVRALGYHAQDLEECFDGIEQILKL